MSSESRRLWPHIGAALTAFVLQVAVETAQFASTELAQELAWFFERTGRDAVAAVDPATSGAFVAALYIAGDLRVVRAHHPAVREVTSLIESRRFVDVYSRLRATPTPAGKFFVMDANANGLLTTIPGADNVDLVRAGGDRQMLLNGPIEQNMTAAQYDAALADAHGRYVQLLRVLLSAVER